MVDTPDAELERLRARVVALEAELVRLREEHRIEREHDRLRHQDHSLGLIAEAEAAHEKNLVLRQRIKRFRQQVDELGDADERRRAARAELDRVYSSRTWRIGRTLTSPGRARHR